MDVCDSEGNWFISTVLDKKITKNEKNIDLPELFIGYRIYIENGTKTDTQNRKFEGWSENHDEWVSAYSLRIQKYFDAILFKKATFNN